MCEIIQVLFCIKGTENIHGPWQRPNLPGKDVCPGALEIMVNTWNNLNAAVGMSIASEEADFDWWFKVDPGQHSTLQMREELQSWQQRTLCSETAILVGTVLVESCGSQHADVEIVTPGDVEKSTEVTPPAGLLTEWTWQSCLWRWRRDPSAGDFPILYSV